MIAALIFASLFVAIGPSGSAAVPRVTHMRPLSATAQHMIDDARRVSPTIASMIGEIEQSDVFVYVDAGFFPRSTDGGATTFTASSTMSRFLSVKINLMLDPNRRMEVLGHELQHVLEVTRDASVRDDLGMQRLFGNIGWVSRVREYETAAAMDVERTVHQEIWHARSMKQNGRT